MGDMTSIHGIPVRSEERVLSGSSPVVIVIHGMSTTPEILEEGWPPVDDGLGRIYWHLPVLREGREASRLRREHDPFRDLFWPVVAEGRAELRRLMGHLGTRPVGLFGFSIGGFLRLLGAADQRRVRAAVSVGGVPNLEYLLESYPDYEWGAPDVVASRNEVNLQDAPDRLVDVPTLILHGAEDDVAEWRWLRPLAEKLSEERPESHPYEILPHLRHRITGLSDAEEEDWRKACAVANRFLLAHLTHR